MAGHTRHKLMGSVCKCMDCAKARREALVELAWEKEPERMSAVTAKRVGANLRVKEAQEKLEEAKSDLDKVISEVRASLEPVRGAEEEIVPTAEEI